MPTVLDKLTTLIQDNSAARTACIQQAGEYNGDRKVGMYP